ncbi:MAG: hypothetical protein Q9161_000811 [Pseudevernia consocians]
MDIHLSEVMINVDVFELHGDEEQIEPSAATLTRMVQGVNDDIPRPQAKIMDLPNRNLHGVWDSQYFGESGKVVNKLFAMIESMLDEDENTLVCVFVDKIESLAGKRHYSGSSNEPQDFLRAVNALLIALDRLRHRPNVLVFCTSNLIKAVDSAFLDRIDVKQYIPDPGPKARYEILRSCYLDLAKCGIIAPTHQPSEATTFVQPAQEMLLDGDEDELASGWASLAPSSSSSPSSDRFYTPFSSPPAPPHSSKTPESQEHFRVIDDRDLLPHHLMILHSSADEESLPRTLWKIAAKSTVRQKASNARPRMLISNGLQNLSGRSLRRLPVTSLAMYATQDPCPIDDALEALSQAVDNESLREQKDSTEESKMIDCC